MEKKKQSVKSNKASYKEKLKRPRPSKKELVLKFYLPVFVWAMVIFLFSEIAVVPSNRFYIWDFIIKKTAHLVEYFVLTTLVYRALINSGKTKKYSAVAAICFCVVYAATDEFHQRFTPGRQPSVRDVLIDTLGGSLAIISIWKLLPLLPKRLRTLAENLQIH